MSAGGRKADDVRRVPVILLAAAPPACSCRALFFTIMGQNVPGQEDFEPIFLGMAYHLPWLAIATASGFIIAFSGSARNARSWHGSMAKGWCRR